MKIETPRLVARALRRGSSVLTHPFRQACQRSFGVICSVATTEPVLALTFDDGPHPQSTPALLAILAKHHARATFFMVGELAAKQPQLVRAAAQAGHAIANHSWSHLSFPLLNGSERCEEWRRCDEALAPYGSKLFRPPYLHQTLVSRCHALYAGYEVIAFSVHVEDWLPRPAEWMSQRLVRQARSGSIVILHDNIYRSVLPGGEPDRRSMLCALDDALQRLQERFRFITVPELLGLGKPLREHWYRRGEQDLRPALQRQLAERRRRMSHPAAAP